MEENEVKESRLPKIKDVIDYKDFLGEYPLIFAIKIISSLSLIFVITEFYNYHNPLDSLITKYVKGAAGSEYFSSFKPDSRIFILWSVVAGFCFYIFTLFRGKYKFFVLLLTIIFVGQYISDPALDWKVGEYVIPSKVEINGDANQTQWTWKPIKIVYEDKKETIPVIQTATGLEYLITTKIKTLVNKDKKTIGIANLSSSTELKTENLSNQLRQHHNTQNVDLSSEGLLIDENIDVLLVSGATDTIDSITISNLNSFLESGRGVFIAQSGVSTDMQIQQATPINSNIFGFLKSYGLNVNQNLVLDKSCGRVQVQQQMGFIRMNVPMEYPFLPIIKKFNDQELVVSGLEQIHLFFPSEISLDTALSNSEISLGKNKCICSRPLTTNS